MHLLLVLEVIDFISGEKRRIVGAEEPVLYKKIVCDEVSPTQPKEQRVFGRCILCGACVVVLYQGKLCELNSSSKGYVKVSEKPGRKEKRKVIVNALHQVELIVLNLLACRCTQQ